MTNPSTTKPTTASPLRQRMIEDMVARRMAPGTQVGHIRVCKRFAAWLKRSPDARHVPTTCAASNCI